MAADLMDRLNAGVRDRFGLAFDPLRADGSNIYVMGTDAVMPESLRSRIAAAAAEMLRAEPGVVEAFTLDELLSTLNADNLALAVEIARIPEEIRGYGHVKERHLKAARPKWDGLMTHWRSGKATEPRRQAA